MRHRIEYAGVRLILLGVRLFPLRLLVAVGSSLGWVAFRLLRLRRDVSVGNVSKALGVPAREAQRIALRCYRNLGRSLMEFAAFGNLSRDRVNQMVSFEGLENLDRALAGGRGAVLFTGHFGNWELLGAGLAAAGYPIHFLVGEQSNRLVDDTMNRLRRAQGIGIVSRRNALRKVLRLLNANQFVALLADQDARSSGVFVEFFGQPASTVKGPALFALKHNCPVIPGFIIRRADGTHLARIETALWPRRDLSREEAIGDLTQRYTQVLERYARAFPDHYFWPHRRWKTKPYPHR